MAEVWLVCEGGTDATVLNSVFTSVLAAEITAEAAGGGTNLGAVADFVRQQRRGTVAYVADRDYHQREVADNSFVDGKPGFMWRRHSIENYLIQPPVIVEAFERLRDSLQRIPHPPPAWVKDLPNNETTVAQALRECAGIRAPQEAGRMAIYRLWEDLSESAGRVQKRVPAVLSTNTSPNADECRNAVIEEAARIVSKASEAVSSPSLTLLSISARYDQILATISAKDYVTNMGFLEETHGKDLLRQFQTWLREHGGVQLKLDRLIDEFSLALPRLYATKPGLFGTDDFRDLANGVRALGGLPALP